MRRVFDLDELSRQRLLLPTWLFQAGAIGYEAAGAFPPGARATGAVALLLAVAAPTAVALVRTWSISTDPLGAWLGDIVRFGAFAYQLAGVCLLCRWWPAVVGDGTWLLVAVGLPYVWTCCLGHRTGQALVYLVASCTAGVTLLTPGADAVGAPLGLWRLNIVELHVETAVICLLARSRYESLATQAAQAADALARRAAAAAQDFHRAVDGLRARLHTPAGPTAADHRTAGRRVELGVELQRLRRERGRLGTTVEYLPPLSMDTTILVDVGADEAAALLAFVRSVARAERGPLHVTVSVDRATATVVVSFGGRFQTTPHPPQGFTRAPLSTGTSLSCEVPALVDGPPAGGSTSLQPPETGVYGPLLSLVFVTQVIDIVTTVAEAALDGGHRLPATAVTSVALFVLAVLHRSERNRPVKIPRARTERRWVTLTAAVVLGYGAVTGLATPIGSIPGTRPFGFQVIACAALWAASLRGSRALLTPTLAAAVLGLTTTLVTAGPSGLADPEMLAVAAWWPAWTLAVTLGVAVVKRVLLEIEDLSMRTADACAEPPVSPSDPLTPEEQDFVCDLLAALPASDGEVVILVSARRLVLEVGRPPVPPGGTVTVDPRAHDLVDLVGGFVEPEIDRIRIFLDRPLLPTRPQPAGPRETGGDQVRKTERRATGTVRAGGHGGGGRDERSPGDQP